MPFVLIIFGEMLLISGITGNQGDFFSVLKSDFTGTSSFIYWLGAIALIGAIGYVPKLKPISNALLVLVLIVLILHQNPSTLFSGFNSALKSSTTPAPATIATDTTPTQTASPGTKVSSVTDFIGNALELAQNVA